MQQPPGHGADLVEEVECLCCPFRIDGTGTGEEAEMSVDLFRRGEGDAPVVDPGVGRCQVRRLDKLGEDSVTTASVRSLSSRR
ncbi:MAG TPA: hypothetical protein VLT32_20310, partial [Candidatus Sulfomarinibacteraceae bacterium]|nr:hypothetical protein [Candidatus Sulfomarinibacteraceae bacterium]